MQEKRRSKRLSAHIKLSISDLFKQNNNGIHGLEAPIEVTDISRHGVAFMSECVLPLDYYFNASVTLNQDTPPLFTVVKIVRCEVLDKEHYLYGCEFTHLAEILEK